MLPTFNLPGKNISPDRQLAMMRTYLNDLKDNTEGELYDIKWENLAKPLKEKIESLEKYSASNKEYIDELNANTVRTQYLETNYLTAQQISSNYATFNYLSTNYLTAQQISSNYATFNYLSTNYLTANEISSNYATFNYLSTNYLTANEISSDYVTSSYLTSNYITANTISTTYLASSSVTSDYIAGKFVAGNGSRFGKINTEALAIVIGGIGYDVSFQQVQKAGGGTVYALCANSTPP